MCKKEFEYQEKCIYSIVDMFKEEAIVYLYGDTGSGKTTIAKFIQLEHYEKILLTGDPLLALTELGVLRHSQLHSRKKKIRKVLSTVEIIGFLFPQVQVATAKLKDALAISKESILKNLKTNDFILLVIDNFCQFDLASQSLISYIVDNIGNFPNIKVLWLGNNNISKRNNTILVPVVTPTDLVSLGFNQNFNVKHIPIRLLHHLYKNRINSKTLDYNEVITYLNDDFTNKFSKLEHDEFKKFIIQIVYIYGNTKINEWVDFSIISTYLVQKKIFNARELATSLVNLFLLDFDSSRHFIRINPLYNSIDKESFFLGSLTEEVNRYIDYIEQHAPFCYFEKFMAYSIVNDNDLKEKNAFQCYVQTSLEQGKESVPIEVIEYVKNSQNDIGLVIVDALEYYVDNSYKESYHVIESFIENLQGNFFPYQIELIGELFYLRALSMARAITIESGTISIAQENIDVVQSMADKIKDMNSELYLRLTKAILILEIDFNANSSTNFKKNIERFDFIVREYDFKINTSLARYKGYWQRQLSILFSLIGLINIDIAQQQYIMRRSFYILDSQKQYLPKSYLRAGSNYAGVKFILGDYSYALKLSNKIMDFIQTRREETNWGVMSLLHLVYLFFNDKNIENEFKNFTSTIWNNPSALSQLHERYICVSNYALLLCSVNNSPEKSIELMEQSLSCKPNDNYSLYLFYTNLGVLYFLSGNNNEALHYLMKSEEIIGKGIDYLKKEHLVKRNKTLKQIYTGEIKLDSRKINATILNWSESSHDFYFKLGLFSDIAYWSN